MTLSNAQNAPTIVEVLRETLAPGVASLIGQGIMGASVKGTPDLISDVVGFYENNEELIKSASIKDRKELMRRYVSETHSGSAVKEWNCIVDDGQVVLVTDSVSSVIDFLASNSGAEYHCSHSPTLEEAKEDALAGLEAIAE